MAPPSNFQVDIEKRVAVLEDRAQQRNSSLRVALLAALFAASLTGVGWWVYFVTSSVIAIKQQLKDGGNKELVASLSEPTSPALLKANLATVIASVQTAQAKGAKPDPQKTIPLSLAVDHVIKGQTPPDLAWQAASQLINFRSGGQSQQTLPPCDTGGYKDEGDDSLTDSMRVDIRLMNCDLVIDDPKLLELTYEHTKPYRQRHRIPIEHIYLHYVLTNVHIIYGGGIIYAASLQMYNCTFEIKVNSTPPHNGKTVIERLLEADNIDDVRIPILEQSESRS